MKIEQLSEALRKDDMASYTATTSKEDLARYPVPGSVARQWMWRRR